MSEDTETMPAPSDEVILETRYQVLNTCRGRHNRTARAMLPTHRGMKLHLNGGEHRIVRARPLILTENQFQKHLIELKAKASAQLIEVRTMDGRKVDLDTLEASAPQAIPPLPHPPLDSVALDKNAGMGEIIPPYVGDDQNSLPNVLPPGQIPEVLRKKAIEEAAEAQAKAEAAEHVGPETEDDAKIDAALEALATDDDEGSATSGQEEVSSGEKGDK